jgi:hypothetical protein
MENSICNLQTIYSPNRRYANTVNIVFFKADPPSKNFQEYVDGLKNWKNIKTIFPNSQLQIFVDRHVAEDEELFAIMKDLEARVILFECPDHMKNNFHIGLFGTLVRFFPVFDINTNPLSVAHICELEPGKLTINRFLLLEHFSRKKTGVTLQYILNDFPRRYSDKQPEFEGMPYSWILAGSWTVFEKAPFSLLSDYLDNIETGSKYFSRYEGKSKRVLSAHGKYSFGIDEVFLNLVYLPWLIKSGRKIGLILVYVISEPIYHNIPRILKDKRSKACFDFILQKNQSVSTSLKEFLDIFYDPYMEKKELSQNKYKIVTRFYQLIEKYPTWLGTTLSNFLLGLFRDKYHVTCMLIVQNNKIIDIIPSD